MGSEDRSQKTEDRRQKRIKPAALTPCCPVPEARQYGRSMHSPHLFAARVEFIHQFKRLIARQEFLGTPFSTILSSLRDLSAKLYPVPCTLHPAPCTLHPAPCTLHPAPCTLHLVPCTLLLQLLLKESYRPVPRQFCLFGPVAFGSGIVVESMSCPGIGEYLIIDSCTL